MSKLVTFDLLNRKQFDKVIAAVGWRTLRRTPGMVHAAVLCVAVSRQEGMRVECALPQYSKAQRKRINALAVVLDRVL